MRIAIFGSGYFAVAAVLANFENVKPFGFFWQLYGVQGLFGVLCLAPYPDILFRKKICAFFLILIIICVGSQLRRQWFPVYYDSPQLVNYPQYMKDFEEAKQHSENDGYCTYRKENGEMLWYVQKPDYYEGGFLAIQTLIALAPLALFFIRVYQVRYGFTWKGAFIKKSPP